MLNVRFRRACLPRFFWGEDDLGDADSGEDDSGDANWGEGDSGEGVTFTPLTLELLN